MPSTKGKSTVNAKRCRTRRTKSKTRSRTVKKNTSTASTDQRVHPHPTTPPITIFASTIPLHPQSAKQTTNATQTFTYSNLKPHPTPVTHTRKTPHFQEVHQQRISPKATFRVFYFVHVPKTGGVALKKCLQEQCCVMSASTYSPQSLLLWGRSNHKQTPNYTRVLSRGHMSVTDVDPSVPTFCILREPYSRVRSAFRFLKEGGQHSEVWECPEREMMQLFKKHRIQTISDIFTLRDTALRKRILEHPHMRPQHEFICAKGTTDVLVDHVFVLETLRAHDIAQLLHIPSFRLEQRNKSRIPYTLSPQDKQHIQNHYQNDFIVYNRYCRT